MKTKKRIINIIWFVPLLLSMVLSFRSYAQGGPKQDTAIAAADPVDYSANWRMGVFYYNPSDERIFPPKPSGLGWTINFANPLSVGSFILILVAIFMIWGYGRRRKNAKVPDTNKN